MYNITLGDLIEWLVKQDQNLVVKNGFSRPHSDRGDYSELAFTPEPESRISDMLNYALSARNAIFTGYKGGDYKMYPTTPVLIGRFGECGEYITKETLKNWLYTKTENISEFSTDTVYFPGNTVMLRGKKCVYSSIFDKDGNEMEVFIPVDSVTGGLK